MLASILAILVVCYTFYVKGNAAFMEEKVKKIKGENSMINPKEQKEIDTKNEIRKSLNSKDKEVKDKEITEVKQKEIFEILDISDEIFSRIKGKSYKKDCDIPLKDLKYLRLSYYGFDGEVHVGEMIVNTLISEDTLLVFKELYEAKYPIEGMELVDEYDADDNASMEANNSSAFNFRFIDGTSTYSNHAKGYAIDINPLYNPYVRERNGKEEVLPAIAKPYSNRLEDCEYYIKKDDICYQIFTKYGFSWGGDWNGKKDYQHFEKIVED